MTDRMPQAGSWFDVLLFSHEGLEQSDEFALGLRDMKQRLPGARRWYVVSGEQKPPSPAEFTAWSDAPFVLVILNPALLVSNNLQQELLALANNSAVSCVLPSDPRAFVPDVFIDYASRPGFDRFVSRLSAGSLQMPYDGREPWLYLVSRSALSTVEVAEGNWQTLPAQLGARTVTAGHPFIHSYADYYLNTRAEMLPMLPDSVHTLLDIGGGEGSFARLFMDQRGGHATLLEQNAQMAAVARKKGLTVLEGDFSNVSLPQRYDCVTFLDVLEHLADPLDALIKARQALNSDGIVLLSVPNVGHWSVVWDLLEGSFDYLPVGILCTTHLRFFTRRGLIKLLEDAGFSIERCEEVLSPVSEPFAAFLANRITAGVNPDLDSLSVASFHVVARCCAKNMP